MRRVLVLSFDPEHAFHAQSIAPEDSWVIDSHQCQLIRLYHSKCQATGAQSGVLPASAGDPLGSRISNRIRNSICGTYLRAYCRFA